MRKTRTPRPTRRLGTEILADRRTHRLRTRSMASRASIEEETMEEPVGICWNCGDPTYRDEVVAGRCDSCGVELTLGATPPQGGDDPTAGTTEG